MREIDGNAAEGRDDYRAEVEYLRVALSEIADFRRGHNLGDQQAYLLRERARIALTDSLTRQAIRSDDAELLAEITSLWSDYCAGTLDMAALAQEIGEVLKERGVSSWGASLRGNMAGNSNAAKSRGNGKVVSKMSGLNFVTHRRTTYVSVDDLLNAMAEVRNAAVTANQSVYVLDQFRLAFLETYASAK